VIPIWDGSGYSNGLKGEQILITIRIVAIADVFDALTSVRPCQAAWSVGETLPLLHRESGKHFDLQMVELFLGCLPEILVIKERWAEQGLTGCNSCLVDLPCTGTLMTLQTWELLSYIVTVVALPFALGVFLFEQRKERENEEEAIWQQISDAYIDFLEVVLANPDLRLRSQAATPDLSDEQRERMWVIFDMLISLFERAYLLVYEDDMDAKKRRRWHSWEDYMREWSRREDFRARLPELLRGEDPGFAHYIRQLAAEEQQA
jgi:hypothetical protein